MIGKGAGHIHLLGQKGIMNKNRVVAMTTAAILMVFTPFVFAEEKIEIDQNDAAPMLDAYAQKTLAQIPAPEIAAREQDSEQPAEKFLSEFKIYPAF